MNSPGRIGIHLINALLLGGGVAFAQEAEPFRSLDASRFCEVDIQDTTWGIPPYLATNDQIGYWLEAGTAGNAGGEGEASQWTNVDFDYIGGFLYAETNEWGGHQSRSQSNLRVWFTIERTGMLHASAQFSALFSDDLGEVSGRARLSRVDNQGQSVVDYFDLQHLGAVGDPVEMNWNDDLLLHPGDYRFEFDVTADVHGVEIWPDQGSINGFALLELDKLPECGEPDAGSCDVAKSTPSCSDSSCCESVCTIDPYCCSNSWDSLCVKETLESCGICVGDLNGDGTVNGADQGLLFAAWGPHSPTYIHPADFNQDMVVNGEDLGILMAAWGDC